MTRTLTRDTLHRDLLRGAAAEGLTESDALLWMALLHTHQIQLHPGAVSSANGELLRFAALTQRHAAEIIAELWAAQHPERDARAAYGYWYGEYNRKAPFEVFEDIPQALRARLTELRDAMARDPRVASVTPED